MLGRKKAFAILLAPLFVALLGCHSAPLDYSKRLTSFDMIKKRPPDALYTVDPPDQIQVEFTGQGEPTRSVTLRSDGMVTLPLVGDVLVAGKTTQQIQDLLTDAYSKYYKDPKLFVSVTGYNSKHLYVYGEVGNQGSIPYRGYTTVRDVIGEVGGVTSRAASGRIKVIRGDPDDPEIYKVDLDAMLDDGDTLQDVSLAENDVVYVPPTVMAWIGYQVDQLLFPFRSVIGAVFTVNTLSNVGGGNRNR
jgi:polysaccharide export outer membrane protein